MQYVKSIVTLFLMACRFIAAASYNSFYQESLIMLLWERIVTGKALLLCKCLIFSAEYIIKIIKQIQSVMFISIICGQEISV